MLQTVVEINWMPPGRSGRRIAEADQPAVVPLRTKTLGTMLGNGHFD
jgi:hypothetical protein